MFSQNKDGTWVATADWIQINSTSGNHVEISPSGISIVGSQGGIVAVGGMSLLGGLTVENEIGQTVDYVISTPNGNKILKFRNGILVGYEK